MDNLFQRLDLNLLRVFDTLMQSRNVTRTAERLNLSQSTVSHALGRLRQTLNDPLFVMARKEMHPTERARALAAPVRQALALLEQGIRQVAGFDPGQAQRTFRLAVPSSIEYSAVPLLVEMLHQRAPDCRLAVTELVDSDYETDLAQGELDMVVGFAGSGRLSPRLLIRPWFDNALVCLASNTLGLGQALSPRELADWVHVSTSTWGHSQTQVEHWLHQRGISRRIGVWVSSFAALPGLLGTGRYLAVVPELIARDFCHHYPLSRHDLDQPLTTTYVLAQHPLTEFDPALIWFRQLLEEVGDQLG